MFRVHFQVSAAPSASIALALTSLRWKPEPFCRGALRTIFRAPLRAPLTFWTQALRTLRLAGRDIGRSSYRREPVWDHVAPRRRRPALAPSLRRWHPR